MSETASLRYIARTQPSVGTRSYEVIDTRDDDRAVLESVPGSVIIDVVDAMNAAYAAGLAEQTEADR